MHGYYTYVYTCTYIVVCTELSVVYKFQSGYNMEPKFQLRVLYFLYSLLTSALLTAKAKCLSSTRHGRLVVTCHLETHEDYIALSAIPPRTKELVCNITGEFTETASNFTHLKMLEKLKFESTRTYLSYQMAYSDIGTSVIGREDIFQNLTNLKYLGIHLVMYRFSPQVLQPLKNLKVLDMSYSQLTPGTMTSLMEHLQRFNFSLMTLNLTGAQRLDTRFTPTLIDTKDDIFQYLGKIPLKHLDLSENLAVRLQPGLSLYLPNLRVFLVGANDLLTLYQGSYRPFSLECVIIDLIVHPKIVEYKLIFPRLQVPHRLERDLGGIFSVISTDHYTSRIQQCDILPQSDILCTLGNCLCADFLNFTCELFQNISLSEFISPKEECLWGVSFPLPPSLEIIVVTNIFIDAIRGELVLPVCFNPSNGLKYLDLSNNELKDTIVKPFGLRGLHQLRYFSLQHSGITVTEEMTFFTDTPELNILLLGGNPIFLSGGQKNDFLRLPNLQSLDMEACGLEGIPYNTFTLLRTLEHLNLSRNNLVAFNVNLTGLSSLRLLNLSGNDIRYLGFEVTSTLNLLAAVHNITLDLSLNPLECNCATTEFLTWLHSTRVFLARKELIRCSHPTSSTSISPWSVDPAALHKMCINFDIILTSVLCSFGICSAIAIALLMYKKRWKIRYWIHAARESWRQSHDPDARPNTLTGYTYDAFVAYSTNGEERSWVHTTLREKLEGEHGLKLCIYYRDFKLGRDLADTIVEAINVSRKTLLILSPNFLHSSWCEFEVRMAHEKVVTEKRDSLILVIFTKLDQAGTRIPRKLAKLLEKRIYIEWTQDPDGQKLFWRRLVESIHKEKRYDAFRDLCDTAV